MNKFSSPADKQKGFSSASSNPHKLTNSNDGTAQIRLVNNNHERFEKLAQWGGFKVGDIVTAKIGRSGTLWFNSPSTNKLCLAILGETAEIININL